MIRKYKRGNKIVSKKLLGHLKEEHVEEEIGNGS